MLTRNRPDGIGNPLTDGTWTYTWQHGRQLKSMSDGETTWTYTYDANGLRTGRTNGTDTYRYVYNDGGQLTFLSVNGAPVRFAYSPDGLPMSIVYNNLTYYYVTNLQGDVLAILDINGAQVVGYTYDAWGNVLSITGTMAATLGQLNPLRYRGYVYDQETQLYYLQSRYYNPETGRFLNADAFAATGQGLLGNNMFAYCNNSPSSKADSSGAAPYDLFDSPDEAAEDFANCYNAKSIADGKEYGSLILMISYVVSEAVYHEFVFYVFGHKFSIPYISIEQKIYMKYFYNEPAIGSEDGVIPNLFSWHLGIPVSTVHTHANYDPELGDGNDTFSTGRFSDIYYADKAGMNIYVATPIGHLKKYTYSERNSPNGGITTISKKIPWDPNHPKR